LPPFLQDDFFDLSAPTFFQQGDLFPDAPLISIPESEHLIIVRSAHTGETIESPSSATDVTLHHEQAINAFSDDRPEHVLVSAQRGPAMIVTQTCDLMDNQNWLVCPCYSVEGSDVKPDILFSEHPLKNYRTLFGLPAHPSQYFDARYVDLADIRTVHRGSLLLSKRIASLKPLKQQVLNEKIARMFSREWGYRDGEDVPEDGKYRCRLCNWFIGVANPEIDLKKGDKFPKCDGCAKIHKTPQWYLLQPHRRF
jgi:hypothetical protein